MIQHSIAPSDKEFQQAFEKFEIPKKEFNHRSHIRLAYIYLCQNSPMSACQRMKRSLISYLKELNIDNSKYNETITCSWMMAVSYFMTKTSPCFSADNFISKNPQLLNDKIIYTHYSSELLFSERARKKFVSPDIQEIPGVENFSDLMNG